MRNELAMLETLEQLLLSQLRRLGSDYPSFDHALDLAQLQQEVFALCVVSALYC
jgi:hypothetical protein